MGHRLTTNKDLAQLIKKAVKQGWVVEATKGNHLRWISPSGDIVISAKTPSDRMTVMCTRLDIKRKGYKD
jgi:predicted RNA binding protein YcfA (HicA-like mRNA interferase family)